MSTRLFKFSITNGNYVGYLRGELMDVTTIESSLVSVANPFVKTATLRVGMGRKLKAHASFILNYPCPVAKCLPRSIEVLFYLVFTKKTSLDSSNFINIKNQVLKKMVLK